ncbi:hypothetical protein [Nostoc sp. T09]|uniref:hypothetical protein n=1 Tax=Nostoc sp. T09 TaxID=1932621 RepID=UPI0015C51278|nr:hypothetical protein [Nostoc sp. T09]
MRSQLRWSENAIAFGCTSSSKPVYQICDRNVDVPIVIRQFCFWTLFFVLEYPS